MPAIGYVTYDADKDAFKGNLKTLTISCPIRIEPNRSKSTEKHPDYLVLTDGIELGAAWKKLNKDDQEYVTLSLAAPEFGRRKLYANLGRAAGQDDDSVFAIIWNTDDD